MRLVIGCFNGMQMCLKEDATREDLSRLAKRREAQGFDVDWLSPLEIEVNSDGMISDYMGIVSLVSDDTRLHEAGE